MKIKNIGLILVLLMIFISCDDDVVQVFDHAEQAKIDDKILIDYLETHYYDADLDVIDVVSNNETTLMSQVTVQNVVENEIDYKLYYMILEQGSGYTPSRYDDILTTYRGELLDGTVFDDRPSIAVGNPWINLLEVVSGWSYGFINFKGGLNTSQPNEPLSFTDTTKGFLFFPSGLGYRNAPRTLIPANSPLVFKIDLQFSKPADHDNDGIPTNDEDIDGDGEVTNDNTDSDALSNFVDPDDDNDGKLTINEDADGDGDPRNDDSDGDGIPDYLDSDS